MKGSQDRISRPIVSIAIVAISIGVALMILSVAVLQGFQQEIRNKVIGFGSHIRLIAMDQELPSESTRVLIDQDFYPSISDEPGVKHIQQFALKPGIVETREALEGAVIKGVAEDYDWSFIAQNLTEGELIDSALTEPVAVISNYLSRRLKKKVGEKIRVYFVQNADDVKPKVFTISGIYDTGLEEFDSKYVFVGIHHIQTLSNWGLQAQIKVADSCEAGRILIEGLAFGGDGRHVHCWPDTSSNKLAKRRITPVADTLVTYIVQDQSGTVPDTAFAQITLNEQGNCTKGYSVETWTSGGSHNKYCGGFEVLVDDYDDLSSVDASLLHFLPFDPSSGNMLTTRTVLQENPEIFNWLEMLDVNVYIVIGLMIFIAIVNMTSALLIIILEKTRMIGVLKAFGAEDSSVIGVFVINSAVIIGLGLLIGNALGLGLALLQENFQLITLDPSSYFVDYVPIRITSNSLILLNLLTVAVCWLFIIVPSVLISTVSPVKAIRFT
jgi:lipoprotein-releasing system permease protein